MSIASEITRINGNIADAYSACSGKGATMPQTQNSANLADTIDSIQQGGGGAPTKKNINFYDYDGSLLYGYSFAEVAELSELPALPSHEGLTAQGWTHTLAQIQAVTQDTNVGCYYATSDGKTHIIIELRDSGTFEFWLIQSAANAAVIDWGDGSPTETLSVSGGTKNSRTRYKAAHTYSVYPAVYDISITAVSGQWYGFGTSNTQYTTYGITGGSSTYGAYIKRVYLSADASIMAGCFICAGGMEYITATEQQSAKFGLKYSFAYCYSLRFIIAYAADETSFNQLRALKTIVFRPDFSPITHTIDSNSLYQVYLEEILIPNGITAIGSNAFGMVYNAKRIVIPASVASIGHNAFSGTDRAYNRLLEVDLTAFTDPSSIPTITYGVGVIFVTMNFTEGDIKFLVASETMKTAFSNDTNWGAEGSDLFVVQ